MHASFHGSVEELKHGRSASGVTKAGLAPCRTAARLVMLKKR